MINKYDKQILLSVFITIIVIIFLILILQDKQSDVNIEKTNNKKAVESTTTISYSKTSVSETIGKETAKKRKKSKNTFIYKDNTGKNYSIKDIKKLIDFSAEYPYMIRVNRAENFVTVYGMDFEGKHTIPYKTFWCSTGSEPEYTPLGQFEMTERYDWRIMVDGTYAQYAIRIYGAIMLHSIPYLTSEHDSLEYWEYNKLGQPASLGCIRLRAGDIKWIYDNCKDGTKVTIYSEPDEKPVIKLSKIKKIKKTYKNRDWDPTDPVKNNPWKKKFKKKK